MVARREDICKQVENCDAPTPALSSFEVSSCLSRADEYSKTKRRALSASSSALSAFSSELELELFLIRFCILTFLQNIRVVTKSVTMTILGKADRWFNISYLRPVAAAMRSISHESFQHGFMGT